MTVYLLLVKISPGKTGNVVSSLKNFQENPSTGVTVHNICNVFGAWDACIWFTAQNHDNAMTFVQNKIRSIPGVVETCTMPTTSI